MGAPASAQTPCPETAEGLAVGSKLTCVCTQQAVNGGRGQTRRERRASDAADPSAFGVDRYAATSEICVAARHAGVAAPRGATVTLVVGDGCGEFAGSSRNGVLTARADAAPKSFGFGAALPACVKPLVAAAPAATPAQAPVVPVSAPVAAAPPPSAPAAPQAAGPAPSPAPTQVAEAPKPAAPPAAAPAQSVAQAPAGDAFKRLADMNVKVSGQPVTAENADKVLNVYVSGDLAKKFTDEDCAALKALPKLGSLQLAGAKVTAACAADLAKIASLRQLSLDRASVDDATFAALAAAKELRSLSLVSVKGLTEAAMTGIGKLAALQRLNLEMSDVSDAGLAHIAGLKDLQWLSVAQTQVGAAGMASIAKLPALVELAARSMPKLDDAALAALAGGAPKLQRLFVSGAKSMTTAGVAHIARIAGLRELQLYENKLAGGFAPLVELKQLQALNISNCGATDADLATVAKISSLLTLTLAYSPEVTDKGLAAIATMKLLSELYVHKAKITDAGVAALKDMPGLRRLSLPETPVGDGAAAALAGMKLQMLDLRATAVTDASLPTLAKIEGLSSLNVMQTKVTDDGVKAAKAVKPNMHIAK
ncbi:MAG: hypothetical protein IPK81_24135 [Rhodospirillales bacterium]|nr:MAG: hypothetical protein IPK81_24135 [Rhodospirillales bacterium]